MNLPRLCMRDQIRDVVVSRIQDGTYAPGARLKELELAGEFQVSQAPVREALRELESLGLVQSERYRGTYVRHITPQETREAYQLRACMEETAAQLAVPASMEDLALLQADVDAVVVAAWAKDLEAFARHNLAFHRRIICMSGNGVMLRVWDSLGWEVRARMAIQVVHEDSRFNDAVAEHQTIVDLLKAGDGTGAGKVLRHHNETFLDSIDVPRPRTKPSAKQNDT
ncbi:GntR family transcriptional regulator [Aquabacterium sp.]|uniref:GntR family transcriptional regulator n=1 Tax=Aquabacterium sp. TaxID=1872578 RepID=UPI003D6D2AA1